MALQKRCARRNGHLPAEGSNSSALTNLSALVLISSPRVRLQRLGVLRGRRAENHGSGVPRSIHSRHKQLVEEATACASAL